MMLSSNAGKIKSKESDYKVKQIIGKGSFGQVERCEHNENGNIYAVKTIMVNELYVQKIQQQASNMLISKSQYILQLVDHFYDKNINSYVIVTPYFKNGSLENKMNSKWEFNQLLLFFYQISKALNDLFKQKICHLDVKPENILMRADHQYVVCDLGCSRRLDMSANLSLSINNMAISTNARGGGTTQYGSPDLVLNQEMNELSDIWSLGIILYKIIYGKHPIMIIPSKYNQKLKAFIKGELSIQYPESAKFGPIIHIVKRMLVCSNNKKQRINWDQILQQIYKVAKIPFTQQNYIITNFDTFLDFIDNACIIVSALLHYLDQLAEHLQHISDDIKSITKQLCIYLVTITKEISTQTKDPRQQGWQFYLFDITRNNLTVKQIEFAKSLQKQAIKLCKNRNISIQYQGFMLSTKKTALDCLKLNKLLKKVPEPGNIMKKIDKRKAESISDFIAIKNKLQYIEHKSLKQFVAQLINS